MSYELKFGKHKGKTVEELSNSDEGLSYLDWLLKNTDENDPKYGKNNKALVAEIKKHIAGKTFVVKDKKFAKGTPAIPGGLEAKIDEILFSVRHIKQCLGMDFTPPKDEQKNLTREPIAEDTPF